jgi:hypothetical protein
MSLLSAFTGLRAIFNSTLNFQVFHFQKDVAFLDADAIKLIFYASVVSAACAVLSLYGQNYKLLTRLLQKMGATKASAPQQASAKPTKK